MNKEENKQDINQEQYSQKRSEKYLEREHIFPKARIEKLRDYNFKSSKDYEEKIERIGNITLLEKPLNGEASNKIPTDKIRAIYGRSSFKMTQKIKAFNKMEDIEKRTKKIESFAKEYLEEPTEIEER